MDNQKENPIYTHTVNNGLTFDKKVPIRRGCSAIGGCFCSGQCQEIVGWEDAKQPLGGSPLVNQEEEKSHFEDIENVERPRGCIHREHKPPMNLHIPHGKRYIHICPGCKERTVLEAPQISF